MKIMMTAIVTATAMAATVTLAAITTTVEGALGVKVGVTALVEAGVTTLVEVGVTTLVRVGAQTGSLTSLILTGQSESNVTTATPMVIVAPSLTQFSI